MLFGAFATLPIVRTLGHELAVRERTDELGTYLSAEVPETRVVNIDMPAAEHLDPRRWPNVFAAEWTRSAGRAIWGFLCGSHVALWKM